MPTRHVMKRWFLFLEVFVIIVFSLPVCAREGKIVIDIKPGGYEVERLKSGPRHASDILSIKTEEGEIQTHEFYVVGIKHSDGIKVNPPEYADLFFSYSFEGPLATRVKAQRIDLDDDGRDEILVKVLNQEKWFHVDHLIGLMVMDLSGKILTTSPCPYDIEGLSVEAVGPFSAYKKFIQMYDKSALHVYYMFYVNLASVVKTNGEIALLLGWVLDAGGYAGEHVYQTGLYKFRDGELMREDSPPGFLYSGYVRGDETMDMSALDSDVTVAQDFIDEKLNECEEKTFILKEMLGIGKDDD